MHICYIYVYIYIYVYLTANLFNLVTCTEFLINIYFCQFLI